MDIHSSKKYRVSLKKMAFVKQKILYVAALLSTFPEISLDQQVLSLSQLLYIAYGARNWQKQTGRSSSLAEPTPPEQAGSRERGTKTLKRIK